MSSKISVDEQAVVIAIGFAEWVFENKWEQYDGYDRWINPSQTMDVYSTRELFELFLKSKV